MIQASDPRQTKAEAEVIYNATMYAEWQLWRKLMTRLHLTKVVTKEDLDSTPGDNRTDGMKTLNLIREWGMARATLSLAHAAHSAQQKKENPDG